MIIPEGLSAREYRELIAPREVSNPEGMRVFVSAPRGIPNPYEKLLGKEKNDRPNSIPRQEHC